MPGACWYGFDFAAVQPNVDQSSTDQLRKPNPVWRWRRHCAVPRRAAGNPPRAQVFMVHRTVIVTKLGPAARTNLVVCWRTSQSVISTYRTGVIHFSGPLALPFEIVPIRGHSVDVRVRLKIRLDHTGAREYAKLVRDWIIAHHVSISPHALVCGSRSRTPQEFVGQIFVFLRRPGAQLSPMPIIMLHQVQPRAEAASVWHTGFE